MCNIIMENGYRIGRLGEDERAAVLDLCVRCADYYLLHCGILPAQKEVAEIFEDLPPNKEYNDKFVLGVFDTDEGLVGVLDVVRDYVVKGEWIIGLMLLDPKERGKGLGKSIHDALIVWAKGLGAVSFRLGVIEENKNGRAFWNAMGYEKVKEVNMTMDEKTHIVNCMTLRLPE